MVFEFDTEALATAFRKSLNTGISTGEGWEFYDGWQFYHARMKPGLPKNVYVGKQTE